jgi:hypothetical protein
MATHFNVGQSAFIKTTAIAAIAIMSLANHAVAATGSVPVEHRSDQSGHIIPHQTLMFLDQELSGHARIDAIHSSVPIGGASQQDSELAQKEKLKSMEGLNDSLFLSSGTGFIPFAQIEAMRILERQRELEVFLKLTPVLDENLRR